MEIMEDGNLVDRVRVLLQRDMQYYQQMQTVLREPLCVRVSGGKFDFPRHASFAAIKIVTWWEAEFTAAFKRPSGLSSEIQNVSSSESGEPIKNTQPSEFIMMIVESSEQLLEHLHTLIQESLDHADLAVLTATLGAAALVRNSIWCYNQRSKGEIPAQSSAKLNECYKSFHEMTEAVGERLLDLHCRLISLYILNEADSLSWQSNRAFFEKERCSYVTQMWWLYMQGTKADLWNTVSPKMAQRVFSGMLNESLSIIAARFIHGRPSLERSEQFWADAFNVFCCAADLTLSACTDGDEMRGSLENKLSPYIRDIHAKCNELLVCFLLRGAPLRVVFQILRKGLENAAISKTRHGPSPWLFVCAANLFGSPNMKISDFQNLNEDRALVLELNILKSQPQPNWSQLMKVLTMSDYAVAKVLLASLVQQCTGIVTECNSTKLKVVEQQEDKTCGGFLCTRTSCDRSFRVTPEMGLYSLTYILLHTPIDSHAVIIPALKRDSSWSIYLDRQQVWNQTRPPWLNALLAPLRPLIPPIIDVLLEAIKTGASIYQAMSLALACLGELFNCAPFGVLCTALALDENIPAQCRPIGGSILLQIMCTALYSNLLEVSSGNSSQAKVKSVRIKDIHENLDSEGGPYFDHFDKSETAIALAEALCSIDEDNKHTAQINELLYTVTHRIREKMRISKHPKVEDMMCVIETWSDAVAFSETGRQSLKFTHEYVLRTSDWILESLKREDNGKTTSDITVMASAPVLDKPLTYVMFHIDNEPFDRLLIDHAGTNWERMFEIPLSVSAERIRAQILARPDLQNILRLGPDEREAANFVKQLCTTGGTLRRTVHNKC